MTVGVALAALLVIGAVWLIAGRASAAPTMLAQEIPMQQYRASTCGCCGTYQQYLASNEVQVSVSEQPDLMNFKRLRGIPDRLQSCHTTIVGDYFVEGHVPLEAIEKMLQENPDIAGIAMSGMPAGSPGMPGAKEGPFVIYAVNKDGTYSEYMRI